MSHYRSNLRDTQFNVFEVLDAAGYYGRGPFDQVDLETAGDILRETERLAVEDFAASFVEGDRTPLRLVDGEVPIAPGLRRSLDAFYAGEWHRLPLPKSLGGYQPPNTLRWGAQEMLVGANPTAYFYAGGALMARVIDEVGTDEQRERYARPMVDRRWGGTMVLTEPEAGSDVGAGTTAAFHVEGNEYRIEGVKRFITAGEWDYPENIVHLVLARPEGAGPGTKGLSMFIVPKYLVNEDGSLGERNGVYCTRLEDKMGIKGSATCEMTFGATEPCVGYLVGDVHDGIRQMFRVIEEARMLIGAKSTATLSTGYLNALDYAKERVQGPDLATATDKTAPKVTIIHHPNVRRMLMLQKAYAEGMRALLLYTAWVQDQRVLHPEDEYWDRLEALLLPLVKGYSSEKAYELLAQSLQTFGGSGFTRDYPIEQYIRDAKIDTLYEGTTGIQALDLFFRKIVRDQGATLNRLREEIVEFVKGGETDDLFAAERELLGHAVEDVQAHLGAMVGALMAAQQDRPEIYKAGLHATPLLESLAELVIAWLLLRHAEIAAAKLPEAEGDDVAFYEGKIASARFFARHTLPIAGLRRSSAEHEDGMLMGLSEAAF